MSHQVITRMAYNAKTKQIETWQHSNNVWPTTDHFYALDVKTDEQMFEFITLIANGLWQGRKWRKAFKTLFEEYPELVMSASEPSATNCFPSVSTYIRNFVLRRDGIRL